MFQNGEFHGVVRHREPGMNRTDVLEWREGEIHGKGTYFFCDKVYNCTFNRGIETSRKETTKALAYYSKTGEPVMSFDPNWKSHT